MTESCKTERNLSEKQKNAIELLICGKSITNTAFETGISRTTLYDWLAEDAFSAELDRVRSRVQGEIETRLLALAGKAMDTLDGIFDGADAELKLRACAIILRGIGYNKLSVLLEKSDLTRPILFVGVEMPKPENEKID